MKRPDWTHFTGIDRLPANLREGRIQYMDIPGIDPSSEEPQMVWLGHAGFLLAWRGKTLLIDPVFARFIGPALRRFPCPQTVYSLEPDAILVSHAHMDHLHGPTLGKFTQSPIILPRKSADFLSHQLKPRAVGLHAGQSFDLGPLTIVAAEARHGGWRYPWQRGYAALGYVVTDGQQHLYFAGDSAYGGHFTQIGERFPIDTALLPIGAYSPRWFLKSRHLNPPEAVQAARDLKAKTVIPCHFGTYRLALDPLHQALGWFAQEAKSNGIDWQLCLDRTVLALNNENSPGGI